MVALLLCDLAGAADHEHSLQVGAVGGVDFVGGGAPDLAMGLPYPLPALWFGWSFDAKTPGGMWVGAHTAPLSWFTVRETASGDMVQIVESAPWLVGDVGVDARAGDLLLGPYVSAGFAAVEGGVRVRYVPERIGPDIRLGARYPGSVFLSILVSIGVGRQIETSAATDT